MAEVLNSTLSPELSPTMKTFYDKVLIKRAKPVLVHAQFGQKRPLPKNNGKTIEFRKFDPLPKAKTPLTEGIPPKGSKIQIRPLTAGVKQYGDYIPLTDLVQLTTFDPVLTESQEILGAQAGETLDSLTADVMNSGTNVQYASGKLSRASLVAADVLTVDEIRKAVRTLKNMKSKSIKGNYVAIVHPDVNYDLQSDPRWVDVKTYSDPKDIYSGEIGKLYGVRFVETTEAKVFFGDIVPGIESLTVDKIDGVDLYILETISSGNATALAGKKINVCGVQLTISSATAGSAGTGKLTFASAVPDVVKEKASIYSGEGAAGGKPVYSTLILGENAYGIVDLEGGGLRTIIKQLGSAGTADPLDQQSTAGWKATHCAVILTQGYMVRIESVATNPAIPATN